MDDGLGIVCGILILVVVFNLGILVPALRRGGRFFTNPFKGYRSPWEDEQEAVDELRKSLLELGHVPDKETHSSDGR